MFGYSHHQVLWGESWASIQMKISDKPWYEYGEVKSVKQLRSKEDIKKHLGKYVKNARTTL